MIKKYWKNIVSFILIFALLLQIYPTPAYAEDDLPADLECEPQTGMSALYEHAPFEAGMAGTAYLNYYLGTLHFRRNDISLGGMRMPVAIEFYHDAANDAGSNPYGALWATSYNQLLRYNAQSELYAYKNENGTWIYFHASDELDADGNEIWVEDVEYGVGEIGLELRIPEAAERTNYTAVDLIYGDMHYVFDSEGRLIAITDGVNRIEVAYVPNAVQSIACITDPVGREYRFSYVDGYLSSIQCYSAEDAVIANMSVSYNIVNGQLAEVTYASGDKITYEYNTNRAITKAVNIDLCGYLFEYVADTNRISAVTAKAAMGTAQEAAGVITTVTYPVEGQTVITTEDTQQRYTFDGCGRVINCELLMATTAPAALDPVAQQYQCVYGYTLTYGYVTGDNGAIINTVTNTQVYDADGAIEEPSEDETEQPSEDETEPEDTEPDNYEYTEDAYGNILSESYVEDGLRQTTSYTYTADGNFLMSQTDPDGHTVQYQYNLNSGMLESLTDANGNETEYTYNALRELQNVHIDVSGLTDDTGMDVSYSYAQGRLSELTYGDFSYEFTYDIWGNIVTVAMNDAPLVTYDYGTAAHKGQVQTLTYGNGQKVFYAYNALGQVTSVGYADQLGRFQYSYAADGALASIYDSIMQETTVYSESGYEIRSASGTVIYSYAADEDGNETESINGLTFQTVFTDSGITIRRGGASILAASKVYDAFSRISSKTVTAGALQIENLYTYANSNGRTGSLVEQYRVHYKYNANRTLLSYEYTYDGNGNITGVTKIEISGTGTEILSDDTETDAAVMSLPGTPAEGPLPIVLIKNDNYTNSYRYDEAGQLVEVIDGEMQVLYRYTYDASGNIRSMYIAQLDEDGAEKSHKTKTFTYTGGVLTGSVTGGLFTEQYKTDAMGNPTKIISGRTLLGNTVITGEKTLTWGEGRMLLGIAEDEDNHIAYTYNADGLRVQQVVTEDGVSTTTRYIWGNHGLAAAVTGEQTVTVLYGDDGEALGFAVSEPSEGNGNILLHTVYTYVKNLQGDVVRILDGQGNTVVKYAYDPWGVPTIEGDADLAAINPCSYRGYYYDEETGYYYLQSRYYDPEIARFINADDTSYIELSTSALGYNVFAYCGNNPIMDSDPRGYLSLRVAGLIIDGILMAISIGIQINGLIATLKLIKLVSKTAVKLTKKKLIAAIAPYIGTVLQAVLGFTTGVVSELVSFAVDLLFEMSVGYAIAYAIYTFIPVSRRILTK